MSFRRLLRGLRWYLRELSGEAAYDRFVVRHRRRTDEPVPTRREYQRLVARHREHHPQARCC